MSDRDVLRKGFGAIEFVLIGVLVLIVAGLAYFALYGKPKTTETNPTVSPVVTSSATSTPVPAVSEADGEQAAITFFIAYIARDNGNGTVISELGTDNLKAYVAKGGYSADPIICAQNTPATVVAKSATVMGDTAKVLTRHIYSGGDAEVLATVVKVNGQYKIDSITCPDPATGKQK